MFEVLRSRGMLKAEGWLECILISSASGGIQLIQMLIICRPPQTSVLRKGKSGIEVWDSLLLTETIKEA